jgi:chemotaxis protein methyltransferase CheR
MKPFPDLGGKFDLIFCRNVAIYFNAADKVRLFQKIARVMQADGALIVGGSETLVGIAPELESKSYLKGIFYQLAGAVSNSAPPPRPPVVSRSPKAAMPPPRVAPRPRPAPTAMERNEPAAVAPPITSSPAGQGDRVCLDSQLPLPTTESAMLAPTAADTISGEQSAPLAKGKKSLLATIHAGQEQTNPLLKGGPASAKGSLLSQLTRKKKSPGD